MINANKFDVPDFSCSATLRTLDGFPINFMQIFRSPLKMNSNNYGRPLAFHLAPSSGQHLNWSEIQVYDKMPAKQISFVSASDVLCVYFENVGCSRAKVRW